jgi:uncharacterized peroxidase-related enzyme
VTYLNTPAESPLYAAEEAALGYVPNYTRAFALAPDAYAAWQHLVTAVRGGMDLRRYELVTLAAAQALDSRYCSLAHARVLRERFYGDDELRAIAADHRTAGLDPVDVAIMDFAARIAVDQHAGTAADADALRAHGLSETDIFQIVLAVGARRFFAGVLDTVRAEPDPQLRDLGRLLRPGQQ